MARRGARVTNAPVSDVTVRNAASVFSGPFNVNGQKVTNVGTPTANSDALCWGDNGRSKFFTVADPSSSAGLEIQEDSGNLLAKISALGSEALQLVSANSSVRFSAEGAVRAYIDSTGLIPQTTNAIDAGSSSKQWKDVYVANAIYMPNGVAGFRSITSGESYLQLDTSPTLQGMYGLYISTRTGYDGPIVFQPLQVEKARIASNGEFIALAGINASGCDLVAAGGFRQFVGGWMKDGQAANSTVAYSRYSTAFALSAWVASRAGSITAVSAAGVSAISAGTVTFTVKKNGSDTAATLQVSTTAPAQYKAATFAKDAITFVAGDYIEVSATTSSDYAMAGTNQWEAMVEIEC